MWRARRLLALAEIIALAGLRLREATYLWTSDIDHAAGVIHVRPHGRVRTDSASLTPECGFAATASPRQSPAATASSRAIK
jgi:hypothetical protein